MPDFQTPLTIPIKKSYWLLGGLWVTHIGALLLLTCLTLPLLYLLVIAVLIIASLYYSIKKHILRLPQSLQVSSEGKYYITLTNAQPLPANLRGHAFVHPYLTVLPLLVQNNPCTLIFTPEMIDPELFRRLRVRLRYPPS